MPEDRKTADEQCQTQHARPTAPFSYQTPPNETDHQTKDDYGPHREWVRLGIEFFAFVVLICYANSASIQAIANREAANAAATAARTAQQQLTLSERPWIKVSVEVAKPLTFDTQPLLYGTGNESVAEIVIENTIENVGASLAQDVRVWEDIVPLKQTDIVGCCGPITFHSVIAHQTEKCDTYRHTFPLPNFPGPMLFPHDKPWVYDYPVDFPMEQVPKAIASSPQFSLQKGKISFVFVGCVSYRFPFEALDLPRHETQFMYELGKPNATGGYDTYIEPSGVHPEIQLLPFAGASAD